MSSQLKLRRGSTAAHSTFTGADGEATFNTDTNALVTHDGVTAGGFPHVKSADLAAPNGAALVTYLPSGTGAIATNVQDKIRESVSVKDFGAVGDGVADDSAAIENAINAANGKVVFFPFGNYLVTRQLNLSVWKYSIAGERNERGCNAIGATSTYYTTKITYTPAVATSPMLYRSRTEAPYTGVIGPFEHNNITFAVAGNNLAQFGSVSSVSDGAGEMYIFGVRFTGCAYHAATANRASNGAGVITRSGQVIVKMIKCFE